MTKPAQTSFSDILDTPATEVERPTAAPTGKYRFVVRGMYEQGQSSQKKTPFVRFTLGYLAAGPDVDEEELASWLTDKDGVVHPITERSIKLTFYTTPDAMFRLTDFLEHCGFDVENSDQTVRQMLGETPNCEVDGIIGHRASEDGQQIFAEVKRTMKAE